MKTFVDYMHPVVTQGFDLRGNVSPERSERLVRLIEKLLGQDSQGAKILDIGCGTGRFTIPLALAGFKMFGADASPVMLAKAREKADSQLVNWSVQNITQQSFEDGKFDLVFISDLLHHLDEPIDALAECNRVLRPGGWIISKFGAMENIAKDPEHIFFSGVVDIDAARTPTEEDMKQWLMSAGFLKVTSHTVQEKTRLRGADRLSGARAKSISVLHMISQRQFEEGLAKLAEHIERNPNDPWLLEDPATYTIGQKKLTYVSNSNAGLP